MGHNPQLYHSARHDRNLRMKLGYGEGGDLQAMLVLRCHFDKTEQSSSRSGADSHSDCITVNQGLDSTLIQSSIYEAK